MILEYLCPLVITSPLLTKKKTISRNLEVSHFSDCPAPPCTDFTIKRSTLDKSRARQICQVDKGVVISCLPEQVNQTSVIESHKAHASDAVL